MNQEKEARKYLEENNIIRATDLDRTKKRHIKAEIRKTKWTKYQESDYDVYIGDNGKMIIDDTRYHYVAKVMPETVMKMLAVRDKPVKDLELYYPEDFDGDTVKAEEVARLQEAQSIMTISFDDEEPEYYSNETEQKEFLKEVFE